MVRSSPRRFALASSFLACLFFWLASGTLDVHAQPQAGSAGLNPQNTVISPALQVSLSVHRVERSSDGKETLSEAKEARPGDVLEYRATYSNRSKGVLRQVQATLPVPADAQYVARSAMPQAMAVSTGTDFKPEPLMRSVRGADGKDTLVPVPYAQYRSLRWRIESLDAGGSATVSARMRIPDLTVAQAAAAPAPGAASAQR